MSGNGTGQSARIVGVDVGGTFTDLVYLDAALPEMMPRRIVIEHPEPNQDYPGCAEAFARHRYQLAGRTRNNSLYRRDNA